MTTRKRPHPGSDGGGFVHSGRLYQLAGGDVRAVDLPETLRGLCRRCDVSRRCSHPNGSTELREAFSNAFREATGTTLSPSALVTCTSGARTGLQLGVATLPHGSSIGTFAPMWFRLPELVTQMQHDLHIVSVDAMGYQGTAALLEQMLSGVRRCGYSISGVILTNMGTPTGRAWTRVQVRELGEVLLRNPDITVIEDCLFWRSAFPGTRFYTLAGECPELLDRDQLIGVASMSKGWPLENNSLGFIWAHQRRLRSVRAFVESWNLAPSASLEACNGDALVGSGREIPDRLNETLARSTAALRNLGTTSRFKLACEPDGGTNALLDVSDVVAARFNGEPVCCVDCLAPLLVRHARVELYPGHHFSCEKPTMRLNLAGCTGSEFADVTARIRTFSDACY